MTVILLPRLGAVDVDILLETMAGGAAPGFELDSNGPLPDVAAFAPVGGRPVTLEELVELRRQLRAAAASAGYPQASSVEARARFDALCTPVLATSPILRSGEAHRDDVWAFLATFLLPTLTHWRYRTSPDRWHGGVRNTFQRLWLRGRALDRGPGHPQRWGLVEALTEDALVAITERTAITAHRPLAVSIGEGWVRAAAAHGRSRMEPIMRRAIISLRLKNEVTALAQIGADDLATIVDRAFTGAADAELGASDDAQAGGAGAVEDAPTGLTDPGAGWFRRILRPGGRGQG